MRWRQPGQNRGFTLVEVIVSVVIAAMIAGATTSILSNVIRSRDGSSSLEMAMRRAQSGCESIAGDLASLVRDSELFYTRVRVVSAGLGQSDRDELLFVARRLGRVRGLLDSPEGGDFEIAYKLIENREGRTELWRRVDPALDPEQDAGGVISRIASGVDLFRIEATDGEAWYDEWDTDMDGYPHALRLTVGASDNKGARLSIARRVIAIDRVPLPVGGDESGSGGGQPTDGSAGGGR